MVKVFSELAREVKKQYQNKIEKQYANYVECQVMTTSSAFGLSREQLGLSPEDEPKTINRFAAIAQEMKENQ